QLDGGLVVSARCAPGAPPFAAVVEIVRLALAAVPMDAELRAESAPLAGLLPDADGGPPAPASDGALEGDAERARLADAAARTLRRVARDRRRVMMLEDLDRADAGTLQTLDALAALAAADPAPLLTVAAAREDRLGDVL